ncbi:MAG: bacterio-opsin activator, partial [Aquificaceae bacterium]|nr:bacterio-opsin activator [Aquificaceae bacterium]
MLLTRGFSESELEVLSTKVFLKSVELLGGLSKLVEHRTLPWLASLARAVYCVVLKEEFFKGEEEIAQYLGITVQTVKNTLRGEVAEVLDRLQRIEEFI